jgi:rhamnose transport system permease protein
MKLRWSALLQWETLLVFLLIATFLMGSSIADSFLDGTNLSLASADLMEKAIMALGLTLVIIAGEIDLSVESMAGLSCAVVGWLFMNGVPVEVAIPLALVLGAAGGLLNGVLVTGFGLPSLVVTLGTLALYRGLALVVLGSEGVSGFPDWFTAFGFGTVPGTPIPWPLLIFVGLALVLGLVLHAMWPGRQLFALGKNASTARFSGVRVARAKLLLFVLNGTIAALAGVILTARFASSRADIGQGLTLTVVTIVLLGGVNIFGGRGTIPGVVLAAAVLAVLGNVLRLTNVSAEIQSIAVGVLLVVSVVIPNFAHQIGTSLRRGPEVGRGSAATAGAGGAGN